MNSKVSIEDIAQFYKLLSAFMTKYNFIGVNLEYSDELEFLENNDKFICSISSLKRDSETYRDFKELNEKHAFIIKNSTSEQNGPVSWVSNIKE